jgi:TolA-binding protein
MTRRVKNWKIFLGFAIFTSGCFCGGRVHGQGPVGPASDQAAAQALELLNSGKLGDAENAYLQLIAQYPTAGVVPEALFRLGYVQYMRGEYTQAIDTLGKIVSPPATPAIKAAADALAPQVLAAQGAKMAPDDPARKTTLGQAIKMFDAFVQKYPQSPDVQSAIYGRAMAEYQNQDFDEAEKGLKDDLQRFPNSETVLETEDLLGVALTADAGNIVKGHGDQETAMEKYTEALHYLADIIERRADVALANDAQFQIGEVLFDRGNAETGAKRTSDLTHAMDAYRAVLPQDAVIAAQQAQVAAALDLVHRSMGGAAAAGLAEAQRRLDRQNAKLEAVKNAPDETLNAQLRVAACYVLLQKYDEARVLLNYLQAFAEEPDQKKEIQYYLLLTYASQGNMAKAEPAYNVFVAMYRADPIGENLPLVMGAALLTGSNAQPDQAVSYLEQERQLYPNSPLVNEALNQEAAALVAQHKYDDAVATYQKFLATNPPAEQAATAQQGIATIYQQTGKLADAVKQFQKVADTYPGTATAEQSGFYAAALEASVDMKQALPQLQAYVSKFPAGKFTAQAMMVIGQIHGTQGETDAALQSYKDLAAKFPKTEFGRQAYFQQASILAKAGRTDEMVSVLKDFIKAYPDSKDIFYAYDTIGQTQVAKGQMADAVATYSEMASEHSDDPMAAKALYRTSELWRQQAVAQGRYDGLSDDQRTDWNKSVASSILAGESVLEKFPESDQVGVTLKTLLADLEMQLAAKLKTRDDVDKYFHDLAAKYASNPSAQSRILFTAAGFTYEKDAAAGVAQMTAAYKPTLVYAPSDLDVYGTALIAQGKFDDAYKVYEKIGKDYPIPAGAGPAQAPPAVQEAQATALFGMASALDKEGKTADAGKLFAQLKASYPWSPKVLEANFGIAKSLVEEKKLDDASKLLVPIVGSRSAPAALRAHAFLLIGQIQEGKGNIDAAIDSYLKTAAFYAGVADAAPEGLWRGGQMLEKQAETLSEQSTPKKSVQIGKAVTAYKNIVSKYPDSPFVPQAQDRLKALGT